MLGHMRKDLEGLIWSFFSEKFFYRLDAFHDAWLLFLGKLKVWCWRVM